MKIKRMTATFGKLERAELTLSDGLNIIHAPNEAGKSTWCGFLRAMFYGIETSQRDKKGFLAEKNRYAPWSGAPMEGELELEWQGRDITLRRFAKGNAPFGGFSAVYSDTQQPVPGLTGENCGLTLLGVGREVWERSAFVGQVPSLAIDGTPELEKRITALVSSGREDVSYTDTKETLGKWLRRRRHNKTGLIPQLEEELVGVETALAKLEDTHRRFARAQSDIARLEREQEQLEEEGRIHARLAAHELNRRYAEAHERREQLETRLSQSRTTLPGDEELLRARQQLGRLEALREEALRAGALYAAATEQLEQARRDCPDRPLLALTRTQLDGLCDRVKQGQTRGSLLMESSVLGPVAALCVGAALWLMECSVWVILGAGAAVCAGVTVPLLLLGRRCRRRAKDVLAEYGAASAEMLSALWQEGQSLRARLEQAESRAEQSRAEHERALACRRDEEQELAGFVAGFAPEAGEPAQWAGAIDRALEQNKEVGHLRVELEQVRRRCDDLKAQGAQEADALELPGRPERSAGQTAQMLARVEQEHSAARSALALAQGEMLSLGDRAQLEARREWLRDQLDRRRMEYDAIEQAMAALDRANEALQQRFAPQLNQLASKLLTRLTGGRYETVALDREFEAKARGADGLLPRSTLALSRGTAEQVYLAVRLAIYQLCLPGEDASPVVLDDALLAFDDERMTLALQVLEQLGRQVLLFSCQRREAQTGMGSIQTLQS